MTKFTKIFRNNYDFMQIVNKITKMAEKNLPSSLIYSVFERDILLNVEFIRLGKAESLNTTHKQIGSRLKL